MTTGPARVFRSLALPALLAAAAGLAVSAPTPARAQAATPFYAGKTLTLVVPAERDSQLDRYANILTARLGGHIPGGPSVVVEHRPGQGGLTAARHMTASVPRDGTAIGMIHPGSIADPLLRPGVGFDPNALEWLGSMSAQSYALAVWHTVPVYSVSDMQRIDVTFGTAGRSSMAFRVAAFLNATIYTRFKTIDRYESGADVDLAMEHGEVQVRGNYYAGYATTRPAWITEQKIRFVLALGPDNARLPGVPRMRDSLRSLEHRQMAAVLELPLNVGPGLYAPQGTPWSQLSALRTAFEATMRDPATAAEAQKQSLPLEWLTRHRVEQAIRDASRASPQAIATLTAILAAANP